MILVDTSVLLDVLQDDPSWAQWSQNALETASAHETLAINDIVYAELSTRYSRLEDIDAAVSRLSLAHLPMPRAALFLAGKAFLDYRERGGTRSGVLSDFFIGAHAAVQNVPLITRDASRMRTYFPRLKLITPDPHS